MSDLVGNPEDWFSHNEAQMGVDKMGVVEVETRQNRMIAFTNGQTDLLMGARWPSGRVSDYGVRVRGFNIYFCRVLSLSSNVYSRKHTYNTQEAVALS